MRLDTQDVPLPWKRNRNKKSNSKYHYDTGVRRYEAFGLQLTCFGSQIDLIIHI